MKIMMDFLRITAFVVVWVFIFIDLTLTLIGVNKRNIVTFLGNTALALFVLWLINFIIIPMIETVRLVIVQILCGVKISP